MTLIYSGMDAMAFLNMPSKQQDETRKDFISWADRYISFPCREQVSGLDLYGARCKRPSRALGSSPSSDWQGQCRMVGYADHMVPEVCFKPNVSPKLVIISIRGLAETFFVGTDNFLVDLFADRAKASVAEQRLRWMHHTLPGGVNEQGGLL